MKLIVFVLLIISTVYAVITADTGTNHGHDRGYYNRIKKKKKDNVLQIHIIPHSHDDVGWLKTPDQYFDGEENRIQRACVHCILDNIYAELMNDPNKKFTYVEMAFFEKWWIVQPDQVKNNVRMLVKNKRLVFVNAGWSMSDEATVHYEDFLNNMKAGHDFLKAELDFKPTIGWHIDPFGHHSATAALFAEMGFNAWFFARIDHQDKYRRVNDKELEWIWRPFNESLGSRAEIFTHMMYNHYSAPPNFCFDELCQDLLISKENIDKRAEELYNYLIHISEHYRTHHIFLPFGDDFNYMNARRNFENLDRIMNYINSKYDDVNLFYSTPYDYIHAIHQINIEWPTKYDDLFPYSDNFNSYWTGFFTSRANLKGYVREVSKDLNSQSIFLALDYLINGEQTFSSFENLFRTMGVLQHHDAITGTEKQFVANFYNKVLSQSVDIERNQFLESYKRVTRSSIEDLSLCKAHNSTYKDCPTKTLDDPNTDQVYFEIINVSNNRNTIAKIPIPHSNITLLDHNGSEFESDIICSEEYTRDCYIYFPINIPMWIKQEYTLKKTSFDRAIKPVLNQSELKLNNSSMSIDLGGGNVRLALNKENQVEHDILINYLFYKSYQADNSQTSGAYIFRPSEPDQLPENYNFFFHYESFQGKFVAQYKLYGDEIEACITANIYSDFIEVETNLIGIPFTGQGTEVIINFSVDEITNNGVFYTDSMGLEMQKRVIDYRPSWDLIVTQPISENYYPATHGVIIKDNNLTLEILNDRSQGVSSLENGDVEFMIQRRTYRDDFRGVGEPLNEVDSENPFDRGSSVTTRHFFRIYNNSETYAINQNSRWMQREIDVPLIYVYGTKKVVQTNYTELFKSSNNIFDLADDIKAVFLPQKDGSLFVRFENILDLISANHTSTVNVTAVAKYISKMTNNEVNEVYEVSNTGLFTMVEMQQLKLKWRATDFTSPVADYSSDSSSIELGPQRIRSFVISFSKKTFDNILTINSSY